MYQTPELFSVGTAQDVVLKPEVKLPGLNQDTPGVGEYDVNQLLDQFGW